MDTYIKFLLFFWYILFNVLGTVLIYNQRIASIPTTVKHRSENTNQIECEGTCDSLPNNTHCEDYIGKLKVYAMQEKT